MVGPLRLKTPLSADDVRGLKAGDVVSISGMIVTGRDRVHKYLVENMPQPGELPVDLAGTIIYHCGPVMREKDGVFTAVAAGPTTSIRMEMYEPRFIRGFGIRGIMGKGGMGGHTLQALRENGCVYFNAVGGAAVYLADRIERVIGVWKLEEFGPAEALWILEVKDFPAVVTMDAHGNNIHREIEQRSLGRFRELLGK